MKKLRIFTVVSLILFIMAPLVYAAGPDATVHLFVIGPTCNFNNVCDAGETHDTCPSDCAAPVATTTAATTTSNGTSGTPFEIWDVTMDVGTTSAEIQWRTTNSSVDTFFWGSLPEYELGSASTVVYNQAHGAFMSGLSPATRYYFKIQERNYFGELVTYEGDFMTGPLGNRALPPNVSYVQVQPMQKSILVHWFTPVGAGIAGVLVIRSPYGFPTDPADGAIVYEGNGNYVTDATVTAGRLYYYAIFTYDHNGNYSSGVVFKAQTLSPKNVSAGNAPTTAGSSLPVRSLSLQFIQDGKDVFSTTSPIIVDGIEPLLIVLNDPPSVSDSSPPIFILQSSFTTMTYLMRSYGHDSTFETEIDPSYLPGGNYDYTIQYQNIYDKPVSYAGMLTILPHQALQTFSWWPLLIVILSILIAVFICLLIIIIRFLFKRTSSKNADGGK